MRRRIQLRPPQTGLGAPVSRPAAPSAGTPQPLSAPPAQVSAAADRMAPIRSQLGAPDPSLVPADGVPVEFDDMAERAAFAISTEPAIAQQSGVTAEKLSTRTAQYSEARRLRLTAEQVQSDIGDTLAVVGRREQRAQRNLITAVKAKIAALPEGSPERRQLESDASELLDWDARQRALRADKAKQTKQKNKAKKAQVDHANQKKAAAQGIADLADGQELDPQTEAAVVDAYAETENGAG